MLGPLFVAHGASAGDLIFGLLIGKILAVGSWAFLTKVSVKKRLTLYFQLEKIAGKRFSLIYNLINALMFCFLAGAIIAVSATAVDFPFDLAMPDLNDILPNRIGWIITVFVVGIISTFMAMFGFEQVSRFSNVAATWMIRSLLRRLCVYCQVKCKNVI